jgi:MIZ/SP-RING zinc finger
MQCFDYDNYMEMNLRKPVWRCPHCNRPVCALDIRLDQKMAKACTNSVVIFFFWPLAPSVLCFLCTSGMMLCQLNSLLHWLFMKCRVPEYTILQCSLILGDIICVIIINWFLVALWACFLIELNKNVDRISLSIFN